MYKIDSKELQLRQDLRGRYPEGLCWYAVMVHTGREMKVAKFISEEIYGQEVAEVLLPILRYPARHAFPIRGISASSEAKRTTGITGTDETGGFLFRSYLFLRCAMTDGIYASICEHRSVHQILGRAYRIPSILDDREIDDLKKILESDSRPELASRRNIGDTAEIIDGLMAGITGRIVMANAREVKLEVPFSFLDAATGVVVSVPRYNVKIRE